MLFSHVVLFILPDGGDVTSFSSSAACRDREPKGLRGDRFIRCSLTLMSARGGRQRGTLLVAVVSGKSDLRRLFYRAPNNSRR